MLRRYVEQLLNIYNFIDGIVVTDKDGYIEYYKTYRPDINNLKEKDILGKHITYAYPTITEETSSIMQVLRTGEALSNQSQKLLTYKGQSINAINTTLPIKKNGVTIGAVEVSRYVDPAYERQDIALSIKDKNASQDLYVLDDIITTSPDMEMIKARISRISQTTSSVLIYGATGTGKELVAQSIHTAGDRRNKPFISQNCAAIPSTLLESILFGTTKGSYTGAEDKPGLFEMANGGTLFLDEINSMEIGIQSKLLKAIEEKKVSRIGSYKPIETDVKIITAVNENPIECIRNNKIREDLFYRLSVVQIFIPSLSERREDISLLTDYFISQFNKDMNREIMGVDEDVESLFYQYNWPGNVRELRNVIEGAFNITSSKFISKKDLPMYVSNINFNDDITISKPEDFSKYVVKGNLKNTIDEIEKNIIVNEMNSGCSFTEAAKNLGISRQSLHNKIKKHGIR